MRIGCPGGWRRHVAGGLICRHGYGARDDRPLSSFAGGTGAYHDTAIALASDILGSAFTSAIYIRNRNIDLKRGGTMLACIVSMCIAGSIAAWHAGHVVLGLISLM